MVERKNGTDYYHYTYTDHLGSIVATCTQNGNPETEQNFDAWGRKRNPSTWSYSNVPNAPVWLYRGYTGHEGLKNFRLINMNGRMYDPVVGRMLSVDNETHGGTQGLNRYSYALNNPLKYTDPDGENPLLFAALGVTVNGILNVMQDKPFFQGALGAAIGSAFAPGAANVVLGVISSHVPGVSIRLSDNFSLSLSPALVFGGGTVNFGANLSLSGNFDGFAFNVGVGGGYGTDGLSGNKGGNYQLSGAIGYDKGDFSLMFGQNYFKAAGIRAQRLGRVFLRAGEFSLSYENDGKPFANQGKASWFADGGDGFKTANLVLGIGDFSIGTHLFTGERDFSADNSEPSTGFPYGKVGGKHAHDYLFAAAYVGYKGWRAGLNDRMVGHFMQNYLAHTLATKQERFSWKTHSNRPVMIPYGGFFSPNLNTNY